MKKYFYLLTLLVSSPVLAEAIPGEILLDVFAQSCPSNGEWTQAALNDSKNLIAVIDAIAKDEDCKTLGGALGQLATLNDQVTQLAEMSETKKQIAAYDAQERDLLIEISKSTNQVDIDNMNLSLRTIQVGRAGLLGRESAQKEMSGTNAVVALSRAVQAADASFSQIAANQKCQEKNPTLLTAATSMVTSIGSAVSAINPALGIGLQAGGVFIATAADQIRLGTFNRRIRRLAEGTTAYNGYKCALETMNTRWCDMVDARSFLAYKTRIRANELSNELKEAIRLNDREIPVLLDWLLKVKSGVAPQTTADGERQRYAYARKATLEALEAKGISRINQSRSEYQTVESDFAQRWNLIRAIVNELAPPPNPYQQSDIKNPFHDVWPAGYLPYYLIGVSIDDESIRTQGNFLPLDNWKKPATFNPDLDTVRKNFQDLVKAARIKVEREMTEVLRPDAAFTLATAYDIPGNAYKISPMTALQNLISFFEKNPPKEDERPFLKIYNGTLQKLQTIREATENAILSDPFSFGGSVEQESLEAILLAADLTYGTVVIQARLELLARISVLNLIEESPAEDQIVVAQLLASDRFMDTLSKFTGKDDLGAIQDDILRAMSITTRNLDNFSKTFAKMLTKNLQRLVKEEAAADPYNAELIRRDRAEFCHLLLGVSSIARQVDVKLCEGMKLGPIVPGAPQTQGLRAEDFEKSIDQRGCVLHDYRRARKIFIKEASLKAPALRRHL